MTFTKSFGHGVSRSRWVHSRSRRGRLVELLEDRCLLSAAAEIHLLSTPNAPGFASQWDMPKIQVSQAWDTTK
ncbi:MAG: hypothetical protein EXR98_16425 [Gemmataceae bacterium]|nr:hypothetical protein [Gemmataceae bacterium]